MPYSVNPALVPWTDKISDQRKRVISRAPDSLGYTREILHDIVRLFVAQQAGKEVENLFQLRQVQLPESWTVLDSFLHFTESRKARLESTIDFWRHNDFQWPLGTLTGDLLVQPAVIQALQQAGLVAKPVTRQRGYNAGTNEPKFENTWEVTGYDQPE